MPEGGTLFCFASTAIANCPPHSTQRTRCSSVIRGWLACALVVGLLGSVASAAWADDIPWRKQNFDLQAKEEPLNLFLGRMLTLHGVAATMSPPIASAKVNGRFRGPAETIFRELADTYGLTWYHDGSVLHIYSLAEIESRMLQVNPADVPRVERTLKEMRLLDARFPLRIAASEGQILVSGPPQYVQLVGDIVNRVAQSPSQTARTTDTRVFRLRHARAADTVVAIAGVETTIPGVARILNESLGYPGAEAPMPGSRLLPVTVPGLRGQGQRAVGRRDEAPAAAVNAEPRLESSANYSELDALRLNARTGSGLPRDAALGNTTAQQAVMVRADPRINAVIVRDAVERMPMYTRLINELDIEVPLLEIEATVIDVADDKSEQLGIDWRFHGRRADVSSSPNGLAGTGVGSRNDANDLLWSQNPVSAGSGLVGTLIFGSERTNFLARLNALTEKGDANLISKPRVLTLDNTEAVLQSTREFFVRVAGRDQVDLFNVTLGLVLRVTPTLIEDARGPRVKLNIRIEDGNTNSGSQVDQIPVVNRNAISTQAVVGDGQSLLIGGYVIEEKSRSDSGVPVLSEVPGLRWLFGQKSSATKRVERMFLITPRWVKAGEVQRDAGIQPLPMSAMPAQPAAEVL